jgi:hypothetical protein
MIRLVMFITATIVTTFCMQAAALAAVIGHVT